MLLRLSAKMAWSPTCAPRRAHHLLLVAHGVWSTVAFPLEVGLVSACNSSSQTPSQNVKQMSCSYMNGYLDWILFSCLSSEQHLHIFNTWFI